MKGSDAAAHVPDAVRLRPLAVAVSLSVSSSTVLALATVLLGASPAEATADDGTAAVTTAEVEVRILETDGPQLALPDHAIDLGQDAELVAQGNGHEHRIKMKLTSKGESADQVRLALGYERDGSIVIARKEIDARSHAPAVLTSTDGKIKVEVTIKPRVPRGKIDMPDGNDPLDGV